MASFVFKAIDIAGGQAKGEVDAESKQAVADQLKARGLIVIDIAAKRGSAEINIERLQRVRPRSLVIATRQLSTMVSSGMTLLRALYVIEDQTESKLLKRTLVQVRQDVEAGLALSDALERHPKVFTPLYVSMVRSGETGGMLEESLQRVADQLEKDDALRRQVRAAMIYPAVVTSFALIVMLALVAFIVPVFAKVFEDFGGELPGLTQFTLSISGIVTGYWWALMLVTAGIAFAFFKWKASKKGRPQWDRARLKIPLRIGEVQRKVSLARWSRTYSSLVAAGVPMLQAIEVTGQTAGNAVVERAMGSVRESVQAGGSISEPLRGEKIFPPMVSQMVGVGEQTGALDGMLSKIAEFYEDEVAAAIKALTSILEPAMIIIVGAIVGFIVISMYLPMFEVYDQIK